MHTQFSNAYLVDVPPPSSDPPEISIREKLSMMWEDIVNALWRLVSPKH